MIGRMTEGSDGGREQRTSRNSELNLKLGAFELTRDPRGCDVTKARLPNIRDVGQLLFTAWA
jgi:hypothetical protein